MRLASLCGVGVGVLSGSGLSLVGGPSDSLRSYASVPLIRWRRTDCRSWVVACEDTPTSLHRSATAAALCAAWVDASSPGGHGAAELRSARSRAKCAGKVLGVNKGVARSGRGLKGAHKGATAITGPRIELRGKAEGFLVGRFAKRARGGDPRLSRAKERS